MSGALRPRQACGSINNLLWTGCGASDALLIKRQLPSLLNILSISPFLSRLEGVFTPCLFTPFTCKNGIPEQVFFYYYYYSFFNLSRSAVGPTSPHLQFLPFFIRGKVEGRGWIVVRMRSKPRVIRHSEQPVLGKAGHLALAAQTFLFHH